MTRNPIKGPDHHIITRQDEFNAFISRAFKHPVVALDLEGNSFHRYPERICLIQIATQDEAYLIDPLEIIDMTPLGKLLDSSQPIKLFHSADYDVRSLDREWGFRISSLFDTSLGASFLGIQQTGLGNVLMKILNINIPKQKKLQRADWTIRPLSDALINYALEDVLHLLPLYTSIIKRLTKLGRSWWVEEESRRVSLARYSKPDPLTAFLSIKGIGKLDGRGLAILKSLTLFRESEALRLGRPHFRIIPDSALLNLAKQPNSDLDKLSGFGCFSRYPLVKGLNKALTSGKNSSPITRPRSRLRCQKSHKTPVRAKMNLKILKEWRAAEGKKLGLDPPLLWPTRSLERLARIKTDLEEEFFSGEVRDWQRQEFGRALSEVVKSLEK